MSVLLAENFKNLLIKKYPQYTLSFNNLKQIYKRTHILPIDDTKVFAIKKRNNVVETFRDYTQKILPEMEKSIEMNLLKNRFEQIKDQKAKDSILQAYQKRSLTRYAYSKLTPDFQYYPPDVSPAEIIEPKNVFIEVDIKEHDGEDIGRYVKFTKEDMEKYFPKDCFGGYKTYEYSFSKTFGVMCTEEGLKIMNYLKWIMDYKNIDLSRFLQCKHYKEVISLLEDEEIYPKIYHTFAITLTDSLKKYRSSLLFEKLFHTSPVFDSLVNILVQELRYLNFLPHLLNPETRKDLFEQLLTFVDQNADHSNPNPLDIPYFLKVLNSLEFKLPDGKTHKVFFKKYRKSYKKLPSNISRFGLANFQGINSGVFLHGVRGSGKSGVLLYAAMCAHKMNWIVVTVPNVYKWTQLGELEMRRHHASGLYLQQEYALDFLEQLKSANLELLKEIPVNKELYGKYNAAGVHENDPDPAPNFYDPERKVYFKDYERFYYTEEKMIEEQQDKELEIPLGKQLKDPKNLLEILDFGINNPLFSTNAIYEILEQLYNLESHNVLVCVDEYNFLFRPSNYPSFRYENDKFLKGRIPPYHMALCRAFLNFDGHKIKNGFKLTASSISDHLYKHKFKPNDIFFPKGYQYEMNGLVLDDYRNMLEYYHNVSLWRPSDIEEIRGHEFLWMQTQGNWLETLNILLKCSDQ